MAHLPEPEIVELLATATEPELREVVRSASKLCAPILKNAPLKPVETLGLKLTEYEKPLIFIPTAPAYATLPDETPLKFNESLLVLT